MLQQIDSEANIYIPPKRKKGRPVGSGKKYRPEKKAQGRPNKNAGVTQVDTTLIFHLNKVADTQVIINRGGARSSKSYSIMQLVIEYFFTIPKIKILILRKTSPSLRVSIKPLFFEILDLYNLRSKIIEVKSDMNVWSPVKGLIHWGGLDSPEKIKSSEWNLIWIEEATEFTYSDYVNLKLRLSSPTYQDFKNKIILSFNPIDEYSFIKTKILDNKSEDVTEIVSTYKLNPFLSAEYVRTIEALALQDENFYRVYALGAWGHTSNIIFKNWEVVPMLPAGEEVYGLDFGFNNPTSLVRLSIDGLEAGVECVFSESSLTNSDLIVKMDRLFTQEQKTSCPIYADSAEPARIQELKDAGFWIFPADKSVKDGLDFVKRHRLKIKDDSDELIKEIRSYSYRSDKNGRVLDEPIKWADHCMDAMRYGLYSNFIRTSRNIPNIKILNWSDDKSRDAWGNDDDD